MTNEEAIERLTGAKSFNFMGRPKVCEAIDVAVAALGKQIPKKPTGGAQREEEIGKIGYDWCPVCHEMVTRKYCPNCGQRIDWSTENLSEELVSEILYNKLCTYCVKAVECHEECTYCDEYLEQEEKLLGKRKDD